MNTKNLNIREVEPAKTKNGADMWRVSTDEGKWTCFNSQVGMVLAGNVGKNIDVDIKDDPKYKEILKVLEITGDAPKAEVTVNVTKSDYNLFKETVEDNKIKSMMISYAKDLGGDIETVKENARELYKLHKTLGKEKNAV